PLAHASLPFSEWHHLLSDRRGRRATRRRGGLPGHHRADPDGRERYRIARAVLFDAMDGELAIAKILHVRHQIRESCFRDQIEPLALRGFVGRLGPAAEEGDLRPRVHRETSRAAAAAFAARAAAATRAEAPAAA